MKPEVVIDFWFSEQMKQRWFSSTPALDKEILDAFEKVWEQAARGELDDWQHHPDGCLALVILLDQLPLNMFRGQPKSFSTEQKAVEIASHAVEKGFDQKIEKQKRAFLYMPFMHSEDMQQQNRSVALYRENHLDGNIRFAEHHREIVKKFGRFPHRNAILNRDSSKEEVAYLASDSAFKG